MLEENVVIGRGEFAPAPASTMSGGVGVYIVGGVFGRVDFERDAVRVAGIVAQIDGNSGAG